MSVVLKFNLNSVCILVSLFHTINNAVGFMCFDCQRLPVPRDCDHVSTCGDHEACHVTQYVSRSGNVFFDLGCIDKMRCNFKRDVDQHYNTTLEEDTGDVITCLECCHGDFCNVQGCGSTPLAPVSERGLMCFNCPHGSVLPEQCETVTSCSRDKQCSIEPFVGVGGDTLYRSECKHCSTPGVELIGKREACSGCCTSDYCNRNCSMMSPPQNVSPTPSLATKSSTTTTQALSSTITTQRTLTSEQNCTLRHYQYINAYKHCVKVYSNVTLTWHDAQTQCKQDGGDLMVLHNKTEEGYFEELLTDISGHSIAYWVGASDLEQEGNWLWMDGVPVSKTYFFPNEPNNNGYDGIPENCGALYYFAAEQQTLLNDATCSIKFNFICEINLSTSCPDSSYTYISHFDLCYKIYNQTVTWDEAKKQCEYENAALLEPTTLEEVDYFDRILRKTNSAYYWVGAKQKPHETSVFLWESTNLTVATNLWHHGEPNSLNEQCVSIYWYNRKPLDRLFLLNDVPCDKKMHYICQYK